MKTIKCTYMEVIPDDFGGHYEERVEYKEFEDSQVRHNDLCTLCGWSTYPECMAWCPNEGGRKNRD